MEYREWHSISKEDWGEGAWQEEPDKIQWKDTATQLPCLIVRSDLSGSLCGYVGIPEGHPWFGLAYQHIDANVYGGLTYSGSCDHETESAVSICHMADDGIKRWWIGFDCAHWDDVMPAMLARWSVPYPLHWGTYKTVAYVKHECAHLAWQAMSCIMEKT